MVTFNQAQQGLIENLLDARRRASTKLDQAIAESTLEPLFVKNLENVITLQGASAQYSSSAYLADPRTYGVTLIGKF